MQPQTAQKSQVAPSHPMPLSSLHAMLASLEIQTDAKRLNAIVNHPEVYPWVKGSTAEPIDLTDVVARGDTVTLLGEHGGIMFHRIGTGLYEAHTQVLPAGRGPWALECVQACLCWLFTRTEAMEVLTRCPKGNLPALALARAIHGIFEFTNPTGWQKDGKAIPADIFGLRIQDWMRQAPGLVERGEWFHQRLAAELAKHGAAELAHPDDAVHDRYVGAACEMALGGQVTKACILYNRWAHMAGYMPIALASLNPVCINIGTALLVLRDNDLSVVAVETSH